MEFVENSNGFLESVLTLKEINTSEKVLELLNSNVGFRADKNIFKNTCRMAKQQLTQFKDYYTLSMLHHVSFGDNEKFSSPRNNTQKIIVKTNGISTNLNSTNDGNGYWFNDSKISKQFSALTISSLRQDNSNLKDVLLPVSNNTNFGNGKICQLKYNKTILYFDMLYIDKTTNTIKSSDGINDNIFEMVDDENIVPLYIRYHIFYGDNNRQTFDNLCIIGIENDVIFNEETAISGTYLSSGKGDLIFTLGEDAFTKQMFANYNTNVGYQEIVEQTYPNNKHYYGYHSNPLNDYTIQGYDLLGTTSESSFNNNAWNNSIYGKRYNEFNNRTIIFERGYVSTWSSPYFNYESTIPSIYFTDASNRNIIKTWDSNILHEYCNSFGYYYTDKIEQAKNGILGNGVNNNDIYAPLIDGDGINNDFKQGADIAELPYYDDEYMSTSINNPYKFRDNQNSGQTPTQIINLTNPSINGFDIFNTTYAVNHEILKKFNEWIWNSDTTLWANILEGIKMYNNPIDAIVSIKMFPFDIVNHNGSNVTNKPLKFGKTLVTINNEELYGKLIKNGYNAIIDMGACEFKDLEKSFLSYAPYTNAYLYLPYIGICEINPIDYIGKIITVKYIVDIHTGGCTACVFANSIPLLFKDGNIALSIPISATDRAKTALNTFNGISNIASDLLNKNVLGGITDTVNTISQKASIDKQSPSTPICSMYQPQKPYFIIERPISEKPNTYGHNVGYVYNKSETLKNLKGFTICENVHIDNITCTQEEKSKIINILQTGFVIN